MSELLAGAAICSVGAWWGWRRGHLRTDGAWGAFALGTLVFGLGGWQWGGLLVAFFVSASLLTRYRERVKQRLAGGLAKGGRRDLGQVLANGGWGAVLATAALWLDREILLFAFLGTMAAVNADTWATEIGLLSAQRPRRLLGLRSVRRGSSGAVTVLGLLASLTGGVFIGTAALGLVLAGAWASGEPLPGFAVGLPLVGGLAGLLGSLFDSLLGSSLQGVYYCGACREEVESDPDRLGHPVVRVRGAAWLDNDGVNFLASVFGSLVGALFTL